MEPSMPRKDSPIAILENPSLSILRGDKDVRLDDFLNDKLQIPADFEAVNSLLANIETQRIQLQSQLQDAKSKLSKAKEASSIHTESLLVQTQDFQSNQSSIDKRLAIVTTSDAPDEAVERFKKPMEKLRKLELANSYLCMLSDVDDLTAEARSYLPGDPKKALKPYAKLKALAGTLKTLQEPADGAAGHVVKYVDKRVLSLMDEMRKIMTDEFEAVLKKSAWPSPAPKMTRAWSDCFERLLDLQGPELLGAGKDLPPLLPMEIMTKSFSQAFRFHFMGSKQTSSKYDFGHVFHWTLGTISSLQDFLYENIGPVLTAHFNGSRLAGHTLCIDPVSAFITALLVVVKEKVKLLASELQSEPPQMSKFVVDLMHFDEAIRQQFKYDGGDPENGWKGLTWGVLDDYFDVWLNIEKNFALARYHEIMNIKQNLEIDYDSAGINKTKPTYAAAKVSDLLINVTKQYHSVRKLSWKMKFVIEIQIEILDRYHYRLRDSLNAYASMTTTVGRTLHGHTKEELAKLEGTGAIESLCKVYGSADHILNLLHDWSNDVFFISLWNELQKKSRESDAATSLIGDISVADVRSSTSAAVGTTQDGSLFDETISALISRRDQAQQYMIEAIKYSLPNLLRSYINKPQWLTIDDESDVPHVSTLNVTAELDGPLQVLTTNIERLHSLLATAVLRNVWHEGMDALQDLLWTEVLVKEKFTTAGAAQFMRDLVAICAVTDSRIQGGSSSALGMPKLKEGATLLNLPVKASEGVITYSEASRRLFTSNSEANKLLEELDFVTLDVSEARQVIERRMDAAQDVPWIETCAVNLVRPYSLYRFTKEFYKVSITP